MPDWSLRDRTCIAGIGTTAYGVFPETDDYGLGLEALRGAVADCGIGFDEIDGLIVNRIPSYERFAEMAGLRPQFCLHTVGEGRFSGVSLMLAAQAIATGNAEVVALVYGNNGKSAGMRYGGEAGPWAPAGFTSPGAIHAMMFQRHMAAYGTRSEDLAHVAVAFREHATRNPAAVMRDPIGVADHQRSRFVCEPLHLFDYCLINDGGVAWIMTTPERARDLAKPPVLVSGFARRDSFDDASFPRTDYWYPALSDIASKVYERAGIAREELDGLMLYDNFTPTVLFTLEGLGFCRPGESGEFVRDGALALGRGRWPTNTNGGHLSESYMQGWGLIAEAVRQCRGEAGERQISDCRSVLYACAANIATSVIFRSDS
jgi:acetyl-CoA acetyltransferase